MLATTLAFMLPNALAGETTCSTEAEGKWSLRKQMIRLGAAPTDASDFCPDGTDPRDLSGSDCPLAEVITGGSADCACAIECPTVTSTGGDAVAWAWGFSVGDNVYISDWKISATYNDNTTMYQCEETDVSTVQIATTDDTVELDFQVAPHVFCMDAYNATSCADDSTQAICGTYSVYYGLSANQQTAGHEAGYSCVTGTYEDFMTTDSNTYTDAAKITLSGFDESAAKTFDLVATAVSGDVCSEGMSGITNGLQTVMTVDVTYTSMATDAPATTTATTTKSTTMAPATTKSTTMAPATTKSTTMAPATTKSTTTASTTKSTTTASTTKSTTTASTTKSTTTASTTKSTTTAPTTTTMAPTMTTTMAPTMTTTMAPTMTTTMAPTMTTTMAPTMTTTMAPTMTTTMAPTTATPTTMPTAKPASAHTSTSTGGKTVLIIIVVVAVALGCLILGVHELKYSERKLLKEQRERLMEA